MPWAPAIPWNLGRVDRTNRKRGSYLHAESGTNYGGGLSQIASELVENMFFIVATLKKSQAQGVRHFLSPQHLFLQLMMLAILKGVALLSQDPPWTQRQREREREILQREEVE